MQPASLAAAMLLRTRLASDRPSPELIRSTLTRVSPEDRDAWLDVVLGVDTILEDQPDLPRSCVPYLPCPVSTVLDAVDQARITSADVFVDVGAGIGRAVFLTHLLTGAECIGVEVQSALTKLASERAERLSLPRTRFIHGDALDLISLMSVGTVFFLYCPFSGERLERLLEGLEGVARTRQIRICCVDMAPLKPSWLTRISEASASFDLYTSR